MPSTECNPWKDLSGELFVRHLANRIEETSERSIVFLRIHLKEIIR